MAELISSNLEVSVYIYLLIILIVMLTKASYQRTCEYIEVEIKTMKFSSDEKVNSSDDSYNEELDSSRLENLHRCRYCKCTIMPTFKECM